MANIKKLFLLILLVIAFCGKVEAALYIVGNAAEFSWNRHIMQDKGNGVYAWEGYLTRSGELKFMTEADGWGDHWGPAKAFSPLNYGEYAVSLHTSGDYKFRVEQSGYYRLEVDTKSKVLNATFTDGTLPVVKQWPWSVYPVGTAVENTNSYRLTESGNDTGVYTGQLHLQEGALAFHTRPYSTGRGTRKVEAKMVSNATQKYKKMALTLSTDRCSYSPGQTVNFSAVGSLPANARVRYRHLADVVADTLLSAKKWTWNVPADDFRGYMAEVYTEEADRDIILGTIAIDVSSDWSRFPRYGFVATFGSDKTNTLTRSEMTKLNRYHINAVQFQDWHCDHDQPLAGTREKPSTIYKDIANRDIYLSAIKNYIYWQHQLGMQSIFYNLCFGVVDGYKQRGVKDEWLLYKDRNHNSKDYHGLPSNWKSNIYLANPGNFDWQKHLADRNDDVYAALDFDGFQIDQLGWRGTLYDYNGQEVNLPNSYASFIEAMRRRHPEKRLIMNAVSEYGQENIASTAKVDAFYNEVWGCHDYDDLNNNEAKFANLKNIIENNRNNNPMLQTIFAAYMNYCCDNVNFNTPGVVMADAVMMALGGSHLELGGDHILCREYFPYSGVRTSAELEDWMTRYYDFMTAYENLLRGDWTENNATVRATGATINKWAPMNKQITQLSRTVDGRQVIHLLNFNCEESSNITDPNYLLCWHDRNGIRPWPVEYKSLPLTISGISGLSKTRRVWVASPDYMGGALQEITDFTISSNTLKLTLPALQFWTMIVIEPTATTADNESYGPAVNGQQITGEGNYQLLKSSDNAAYTLPAGGVYNANLSLPQQQLTLQREGTDDIICIPFRPAGERAYTTDGRRATSHERGIVIKKGQKGINGD